MPRGTPACRAKRGGRRVGPEARPDPETGAVVPAIGIVAERSSSTGILRESCVAIGLVRLAPAERRMRSRGPARPGGTVAVDEGLAGGAT